MDFAMGRGGLLQLHYVPLSPCHRRLPRRSGLTPQPDCASPCCLRQNSESSTSGSRPFRGHITFTFVAARWLAHRSSERLCRWASDAWFPAHLSSKLRGSGFYPGRLYFPAEHVSLHWTHGESGHYGVERDCQSPRIVGRVRFDAEQFVSRGPPRW